MGHRRPNPHFSYSHIYIIKSISTVVSLLVARPRPLCPFFLSFLVGSTNIFSLRSLLLHVVTDHLVPPVGNGSRPRDAAVQSHTSPTRNHKWCVCVCLCCLLSFRGWILLLFLAFLGRHVRRRPATRHVEYGASRSPISGTWTKFRTFICRIWATADAESTNDGLFRQSKRRSCYLDTSRRSIYRHCFARVFFRWDETRLLAESLASLLFLF